MKNQLKRIICLALCLVMAASVLMLGGCAKKSGEVLNLYTWAGMFPDEVIREFEKTTGITVNYVNFDTDETMLQKLQAANGGEYDLVIADDYIIEVAIAEGPVQKLDKSKIPSIGNVNPIYQGQFFDPTDEYTVPYGAGVQTIVYNPAKVDTEINGYEDLWNSVLNDRLGIIDNYRVMMGMALKVYGYSYNTTDEEEIMEAGGQLAALAPNIRLIKNDNLQDDLLSGEIDAAVMYTSQVTMAKMADPSLEIVFPEEGIGFGIMAMFVPSAAPNSEAAHKFIEFILEPERSAKCFEYLGYYCTNSVAEQYISEDFRSFLTLPAELKKEDMEMIQNITPEADEAQLNYWTAFKNFCD